MKLIQHITGLLPSELYDDDRVKEYEARIIAEEISGFSYSELSTQDVDITDKQQLYLNNIIEDRSTGKPLFYVIKSAPFRDLDLYVDERVLIPRPETEVLVEEVLSFCKDIPEPRVLDIGTGSGAIALSIAHEHKGAVVAGIDISQDAIDVANLNLSAVGSAASRVTFSAIPSAADVIPSVSEGSYDAIVSNPPYIGEDERDDLPKQVLDFEPEIALFAEDNGFAIYEQIIAEAKNNLKPNGRIFLEIAPRHVERIKETANKNNFNNVQIISDLAGRERVAVLY